MKCNLVNYECKYNKNGWCDKHHTQIKMLINRGDTCTPNTGALGHKATQIIVDELPPELMQYGDYDDAKVLEEIERKETNNTAPVSMYFGFEEALRLLKDEGRVARKVWKKKAYLHMKIPNKHSHMTTPYVYINRLPNTSTLYPDGYRVAWTPTQVDMLANDWYEVGYEE